MPTIFTRTPQFPTPKFPSTDLEYTIKDCVDEYGIMKVLVALVEMCYYMTDKSLNGRREAWDDAAKWLTAIEAMLDRVKLSR